jgi:DNA-binding response OmpR family regulator
MLDSQPFVFTSHTPDVGLAVVLVVEDDPEINDLIAAYVELAGFSCLRALCGEDALRIIHDHAPSMIVLDVMLPDIDGFEICRRLRSEPATAKIPIIILTALDQEDMRVRARQCGATEYMSKPFDPDRLLATIKDKAKAANPLATHS